MQRITVEQLNAHLNKKGAKIEMFFNPGINLKTRCGSYIKIMIGLSTKVFFIGRDLENNEDIIESL